MSYWCETRHGVLWHMPVFVVLQRYALTWPVPLRAIVAMVITAALTAGSHHWVERPILRLRLRHRRATGTDSGTHTATSW